MGMTLSEEILARAAKLDVVHAGDVITTDVDWCMSNDATIHLSTGIYKSLRNPRIKDPSKLVFILDHNVPAENTTTANVQVEMRDFAAENKIRVIEGDGICHQIMIEGFVEPGQLVFAADSHTCAYGALGAFASGMGSTDIVGIMVKGSTWLLVPSTIRINLEGTLPEHVMAKDVVLDLIGQLGQDGATYKAMEYGGEGLRSLSMASRISMCTMGVEAGAKNAIMPVDEVTLEYLRERGISGDTGFEWLKPDADAEYERVINYDLSAAEPMVSCPHFVDIVRPVSEVAGLRIDQAFLGSCSNGRLEDMRVAAEILKGRTVAPGVRLIISPATRSVYLQALREGLIDIFLAAGAMVLNPNCSVCWGAAQGLVGKGERLISTGTRNFRGRSGSPESESYLGTPATVAASAVLGVIGHAGEV